MTGRVVTFGELLLRLSPPVGERLRTAGTYAAHYGGSEANVAAALAQWGIPASFVTRLPPHETGDAAVAALRAFGVDLAFALRGGGRMGIYFLEHGVAQRPSRVLYDRAGSAFAGIGADDVDWERALDGAAWFHASGIVPALGNGPAECLRRALAVARARGVRVSVDLNFRRALWSRAEAEPALDELVRSADVLFANEEDPDAVFGAGSGERGRGGTDRGTDTDADSDIDGDADADSDNDRDPERYRAVVRRLHERFPALSRVAITLRGSRSASRNTWSAVLSDGGRFFVGPRYDVEVFDRVGAGDAFAAGLIFCTLREEDAPDALAFAVAASCLKHSMAGDVLVAAEAEVRALTAGGGSGRIVR